MLGVKRSDGNLMFMYATYLATIFAANSVIEGYTRLLGMILPTASIIYPITFLISCIICELWTEDDAYKLVVLGTCVKFIGVVLLGLSQLLTMFPDPNAQSELLAVLGTSFGEVSGRFILGSNIRFWTGSLVAFMCSQYLTILIFSKLRKLYFRKRGEAHGGRCLRYLISVLLGECVETIIFMVLTFMPDWDMVCEEMVMQLYVRTILSFIGLIPFWTITRRGRNYL